MTDLEKELMQAVKGGLHAAIKDKLCTSYNNPLDKLMNGIIESQQGELRTLLLDAINSALADNNFRQEIIATLRHKLAKLLVERFGGELEKSINQLKSDPATRAKITLAIDEVVKGQLKT